MYETDHADQSSNIRRSETAEQRQYEQEVHDKQDLSSTPGDIDSEMDEKMRISNDETKKEGPMKRFYHKVVKPAFPEAITDIKIMWVLHSIKRSFLSSRIC